MSKKSLVEIFDTKRTHMSTFILDAKVVRGSVIQFIQSQCSSGYWGEHKVFVDGKHEVSYDVTQTGSHVVQRCSN